MSHKPQSGKVRINLPLLSGLVLIFLLAVIGLMFKAWNPDLEGRFRNMMKKEEVLSRMRVNLLKSADVEKAAVMADTDELSRTLARESLHAAGAVESDRLELGRLIEQDHKGREMEILREFDSCWTELQKLDKVLLDFAVENSNIKASNLSFTQGTHYIDSFKQSLTELETRTSSNPQYIRILKLACDALTAGFEVLYLHAPHIAAANEQDMDRIEAEIRQLNGVVHSSLNEIQQYVPEENRSLLTDAVSAYNDFERVTVRVLELSRQNTNIKSFELSLGRKRKATAQCDETLSSLLAVVRSSSFEATR